MKYRICDSDLKSGWYKSISKAGSDMPTECPKGGFRCGTHKPIWLNGKYRCKNSMFVSVINFELM